MRSFIVALTALGLLGFAPVASAKTTAKATSAKAKAKPGSASSANACTRAALRSLEKHLAEAHSRVGQLTKELTQLSPKVPANLRAALRKLKNLAQATAAAIAKAKKDATTTADSMGGLKLSAQGSTATHPSRLELKSSKPPKARGK